MSFTCVKDYSSDDPLHLTRGVGVHPLWFRLFLTISNSLILVPIPSHLCSATPSLFTNTDVLAVASAYSTQLFPKLDLCNIWVGKLSFEHCTNLCSIFIFSSDLFFVFFMWEISSKAYLNSALVLFRLVLTALNLSICTDMSLSELGNCVCRVDHISFQLFQLNCKFLVSEDNLEILALNFKLSLRSSASSFLKL